MESLSVDIPLDGLGLVGFPAADAISPVFTLWITLVLMYLGQPKTLQMTRAIPHPAAVHTIRLDTPLWFVPAVLACVAVLQ